MKRFLLLFTAFLLSVVAFSQNKPSVYASVDKVKILIGEPLELTLDANFPNASNPAFFQLDSIPHFEILQHSKVDTQKQGNDLHLSQRITITSWDSGRWQLPAFHLANTPYKTKPLVIDVGYSSFDRNKDYNDIKDVLDVKKPTKAKWYWYIIGAALLLALAALLFPGKKKEAAPAAKEHAHAYKLAMEALQKLKKEQASGKDVKAFYVVLIDVLRRYLQQKKGIHSYAKTTDDLAVQMKNLKLPENLYNPLLQTLRLSDAVKFAKFQPDEQENNTALETIRKTIDAIENS